jgi:arylsulfatase
VPTSLSLEPIVPKRRRTRLAALALAVLAGGGCGAGDVGPRWTRLARAAGGFERSEAPTRRLTVGDLELERVERDDGSWLELTLGKGDWTATGTPGEWSTPLPLLKIGRAPGGASPLRLEAGGRAFEDWSTRWLVEGSLDAEPGSFWVVSDGLLLTLAEDEEPPAEAKLGFSARHAHLDQGLWRVAGRRLSGEGLSVWPGESLRRTVPIPSDSVLRFATTVESAVRSATAHPVTFTVRLDGEVLLEHAQEVAADGTYAWHSVPLPPGGSAEGVLAFEVDGPFAYTAFLSPVIAPAEIGRYGERPWEDARTDLVVFLADTFRADNLSTFGGIEGVTPHLDRFAAECVRFENAWSVSTSTLSAHSSMFSGLYPRQTGLIDQSTMLPEAIETIAEMLARHGYRTGAITDKGFVSQYAGMAQGFQWFDEQQRGMDWTVQRARDFLAQDDGRPVFLFVQTYRAHHPYLVDEETRAALAEVVPIEGTYDEWMDAWEALPVGARDTPEGERIVGALRNLYLGASHVLDRGFGELRTTLAGSGLLESGVVIVTSDHGEAFAEHGDLLHSGIVFEEQVRVPLLLRGPGLEARDVSLGTSLVDLAPTLADLGGIPADPGWEGTSLLELEEERPLFFFQCKRGGRLSAAGLVEGGRKVMGSEAMLPAGEIIRAFDLERDPAEETNVADGSASWPAELLEKRTPELERALLPRFRARTTEVDPERLEELRGLGYVGDEE